MDVYVVRMYTVEPFDSVIVCEVTITDGAGVMTVVTYAVDGPEFELDVEVDWEPVEDDESEEGGEGPSRGVR